MLLETLSAPKPMSSGFWVRWLSEPSSIEILLVTFLVNNQPIEELISIWLSIYGKIKRAVKIHVLYIQATLGF